MSESEQQTESIYISNCTVIKILCLRHTIPQHDYSVRSGYQCIALIIRVKRFIQESHRKALIDTDLSKQQPYQMRLNTGKVSVGIESIKTTSMEDVSTRVLEKTKNI